MTTSNGLRVRFLNVGQGDCTHIVLPSGEHMLIDINRDAKHGGIDVIEYLADELPAASKGKKQRLDYLVITHPHDDHICAIGELRDRFEIGELWHSGHELDCEEGENQNYDDYLALIDELGDNAIKVCAKADVFRTIGDVTFHVYRPSSYVTNKKDQTSEDKRSAIHNECMVLKMTHGGTAVMFTGDSHKGAWESIVKHYEKDGHLAARVLHASHHGSRTFFKDSCEDDDAWTEHLDAIGAETIVVSVGADNQHDHPHDDMMDEYEERVGGKNLYRTDRDLTVEVRIDAAGTCSWELDPESLQDSYQLDDDSEHDADRKGGTAIAERTRKRADTPTRTQTTPNVLVRPRDIPAIDTLAHRKPVPWPARTGYSCAITCESFHASGGGKPRVMLHPRVPKHARLEFRATTNTPAPYDVQWQVTNSGNEAKKANALRGDFYPGSGRHGLARTETTLYHGTHVVQAFVVKDGQVVARSEEMHVRIEKR